MTEATEEERLEALSHRYVDAARVVLLASGNFAVFSMAGGQILGVVAEAELGPLIAEACRRSAEAWTAAKADELAAKRKDPVQLPGSFEDLGL